MLAEIVEANLPVSGSADPANWWGLAVPTTADVPWRPADEPVAVETVADEPVADQAAVDDAAGDHGRDDDDGHGGPKLSGSGGRFDV